MAERETYESKKEIENRFWSSEANQRQPQTLWAHLPLSVRRVHTSHVLKAKDESFYFQEVCAED
jgi:hypothetical protein